MHTVMHNMLFTQVEDTIWTEEWVKRHRAQWWLQQCVKKMYYSFMDKNGEWIGDLTLTWCLHGNKSMQAQKCFQCEGKESGFSVCVTCIALFFINLGVAPLKALHLSKASGQHSGTVINVSRLQARRSWLRFQGLSVSVQISRCTDCPCHQ